MINPISPEYVYLIHQEKIQKLEREIELVRIAKEQRGAGLGVSVGQRQTWYAQVSQWMKAKLFNRAPVRRSAGSQQEMLEEPCSVVPC